MTGRGRKATPLPSARLMAEGIAVGHVYPAATFRQRLGLTQAAWRSLCRAGLPTYRIGKRVFVVGDDAIGFFRSMRG